LLIIGKNLEKNKNNKIYVFIMNIYAILGGGLAFLAIGLLLAIPLRGLYRYIKKRNELSK